MEQVLPRESGMYLKIILGTVNVSILDKKARYDYKDQYEQFKLIVNLIGKMLNTVLPPIMSAGIINFLAFFLRELLEVLFLVTPPKMHN